MLARLGQAVPHAHCLGTGNANALCAKTHPVQHNMYALPYLEMFGTQLPNVYTALEALLEYVARQ